MSLHYVILRAGFLRTGFLLYLLFSTTGLRAEFPVASYTSMAVYNDTPYIVFQDASAFYKPTVMKFNGGNWEQVGSGPLSMGPAYYTCIAFNTTGMPYIAYSDGSDGRIYVKKYNGNSWELVGTGGFSTGSASYICLVIDSKNMPWVTYSDVAFKERAVVKKYNGTAWVPVGTETISEGIAYFTSLSFNSAGIPYLAYYNKFSGAPAVKKLNGSKWDDVGSSGFPKGSALYISVGVFDDVPYVVYQEEDGKKAVLKKFNGTGWETVGGGTLSDAWAAYISMTVSNGDICVAFMDNSHGFKATVRKAEDSGWRTVGIPGFSEGQVYFTSLVADAEGVLYVAYRDGGRGGRAVVKKFDGSEWLELGAESPPPEIIDPMPDDTPPEAPVNTPAEPIDYDALQVSKLLTPNGDGINDVWVIENIEKYPDSEIRIFDRGGRLLLTMQNYANDWGGQVNGNPLASGSYYFTIRFGRPGARQIKGYITVIR